MSMRRTLLAAALFAVAACSSDNNNPGTPDGPPVTTPDAPPPPTPDAPTASFAGFVKDLILNQTADDTPAVAVDFVSPDSEDPDTFSSLFGSD